VSKRGRGRPKGFKLTEYSKEKIRQYRLGTRHSDETKDKISSSLRDHFKSLDRFSDTMVADYRYQEDVSEWIDDNQDELDDVRHILTNKRMVYVSQMEICKGLDIYDLSHNATPEFFLLLKEELLESNSGSKLIEVESLM